MKQAPPDSQEIMPDEDMEFIDIDDNYHHMSQNRMKILKQYN
jgi:hypothetical protein